MITRRFDSNLMNTTVKILKEILYIFRITYMYVTIVLQCAHYITQYNYSIELLLLKSLSEMPVPSQGHYGFHSVPVVD
jgi:hypothetical protein